MLHVVINKYNISAKTVCKPSYTQLVSGLMCFYVVAKSWVFQSMYHGIRMSSQATHTVTSWHRNAITLSNCTVLQNKLCHHVIKPVIADKDCIKVLKVLAKTRDNHQTALNLNEPKLNWHCNAACSAWAQLSSVQASLNSHL